MAYYELYFKLHQFSVIILGQEISLNIRLIWKYCPKSAVTEDLDEAHGLNSTDAFYRQAINVRRH